MTAIETRGVTKRFGDVTAVDDVSLTVEQGEVFGFLGPNGAGKSTTINTLLGFLEPTAGEVSVLGHDVTTDACAARERIGLLPEGFGPYENLTGREHVVSAIETKGADDDPDAIIERVGLDPEDARRPAGEYSTGMGQRMALAVALAGDPDLLILDEPSSGLDPNGVSLLRRIIREEAERGATVFFSSHILDEVERVCDRVGIMRGGELAAVSTVEDLRSDLSAGATVTATLDRAPDALSLDDVDGVTDATVDGTTVEVSCARPGAKMRALCRLDDAATVEDIAVEDASLESLFEEYTSGSGDDAASSPTNGTADGDARAVAGGESR